MKESNTTVHDAVQYALVSFAANAAGTAAFTLLMVVVSKIFGAGTLPRTWYNALLSVLLVSGVCSAGMLAVTYLWFRAKIPDVMPKRGEGRADTKTILRYFLFTVLPGEIVRAILVSLPIAPLYIISSYRFFDGVFAFIPNFIFDSFYLTRYQFRYGDEIWARGFTLQDNLVFLAVYAVYFALNGLLLWLLYSNVWKKYENERESEIRLRMDPEQMK